MYAAVVDQTLLKLFLNNIFLLQIFMINTSPLPTSHSNWLSFFLILDLSFCFSLSLAAASPIQLLSTNQVPNIDLPSPLIEAQTEEEREKGGQERK